MNKEKQIMKIIHIRECRIIMKTRNEYSIKSPIGVFKNINDAIEAYPYLKEHKRISECPICNTYFIKYGKEDNARKYCSKECAETYKRIREREANRMYARDKWLRESNHTRLKDKDNRSLNWEYHQNDTFWGLGESNLHEHPKDDFKHEENIIKKELRRIYGRRNNEKLQYRV